MADTPSFDLLGSAVPSMFGGKGVSDLIPGAASPFPDTTPATTNTGIGPTVGNEPRIPWYDKVLQNIGLENPQKDKIFGMSPNSFSSVFGQLASAINPKGVAGRIGQLAASMGQAKMLGEAAKEQDKANKAYLLKLLSTQGHQSVAGLLSDPNFNSNSITNNPFAAYLTGQGADSIGNKTPHELGLGGIGPLSNVKITGGQ